MAFLEVNELRLPVKIDTPERFPEERGLKADSWDGRTIRVINKRVNRFELETTPLTDTAGDMFYEILQGRGHFYPFDVDLYSSKGLSPSAWDSYTITSGKHNSGIYFTDTGSFILPTGDWTVSFWMYSETTWTHYVVDSTDTVYVDNATGSLPNGITISDNNINFFERQISDLIILPCLVTTSFITSRYESTRQFSLLPHLKLSGDAFNDVVNYEASVKRDFMTFSRFGNFYVRGQILTVEFIQV